MPIYSIDGMTPVVHPTAYVHPTAILIGDVIIGPGCYIGPAASLRGDLGRLLVEAGANIQDTCVLHSFPGADMIVEQEGHVGHGAVLHGCTVKHNAMIGINAVVMDGAVIGEASIVAAAAFIKTGFNCPPRSLVIGSPGKVTRELTDNEIAWKSEGTSEYKRIAIRSLKSMQQVEALTEVEPDRKRFTSDSFFTLDEARRRE
ncbi:MAG: phenylacetic acid degradation protein PaaY [Gammaproteobacteria bacterium]